MGYEHTQEWKNFLVIAHHEADTGLPYGFKFSWKPCDDNPHMEPSAGAMDHYRCTLTYYGRRMTVIYSKGCGHNGKPPEAREVLECLFSELSLTDDYPDFDDFQKEFGGTLKSFRAAEKQSASLRRLFGADFDEIADTFNRFSDA